MEGNYFFVKRYVCIYVCVCEWKGGCNFENYVK